RTPPTIWRTPARRAMRSTATTVLPTAQRDAVHRLDADARGRTHGVCRARRRQRVAPAQRHDSVAAAGALPDVQVGVLADLRAGRPDDADAAVDRLAAAAARRPLYRSPPDAVCARRRHDDLAGRPPPALGRGHVRSAARGSGPARHPPAAPP